jgi:hypothetical protein
LKITFIMLRDYFTIAGVLFVLYCIARVPFWCDQRLAKRLPREWHGSGHAVDASPLVTRLQRVREENYAGVAGRPAPFKREALVESKRQELAQMAFFQRPVTPEPPPEEHQDHLMVLMV